MTIFWVYFDAYGGHELKLQVDAINKEEAVEKASSIAANMTFAWLCQDVQACR